MSELVSPLEALYVADLFEYAFDNTNFFSQILHVADRDIKKGAKAVS